MKKMWKNLLWNDEGHNRPNLLKNEQMQVVLIRKIYLQYCSLKKINN
jgi:hypothetical protein